MAEQLFAFCSNVAIAAWLGLGCAAMQNTGQWQERFLFVAGRAIPLGLCFVYVVVLASYWGTAPGGGFSSLAAVQALFAAPGKMLGAWLHFLAFDLLVGHWLVATVLRQRLARWPLVLLLPLAFLFGPASLVAFGAWRGRRLLKRPA
jgi:hypothetical protein